MWWSDHSVGSGWPWEWWMPFHGILSLLMLALVIAGIVALVRWALGAGAHGDPNVGHSTGLDVLAERYAKGEMQRDEYLEKKRDLGG